MHEKKMKTWNVIVFAFYNVTLFFEYISIPTLTATAATVTTTRPIIGILAQEYNLKKFLSNVEGDSYIAASYAKAVESSGARVVPILINKSNTYYKWIMNAVNGVVIPGGTAPLKPNNGYYDAATKIYEIAIEFNKNGRYFPILGICLGFEALLAIANNHHDPRQICYVDHDNHPITLESEADESLLFSNVPDNIKVYLEYLPSTINFHKFCVTPKKFATTNLTEEWRITSTYTNSHGFKFISSVEHKNYPIMGVQFHPEKAMFEWKLLHVSHSESTIEANRYFHDILVRLSKLNNNRFPSKELEDSSLLYNYQLYNCKSEWIYEQIYVF